MARQEAGSRVLIYLMRHDIRLSDNPVFHHISSTLSQSGGSHSPNREGSRMPTNNNSKYTHFLPIFVFPAHQVEVSGFLSSGSERSPYKEARSRVGNFWRTGPHRLKFMAEGVWDLKKRLEGLQSGSGLEIRVGMVHDVLKHILDSYLREENTEVSGIWMTGSEDPEEKQDEEAVRKLANDHRVDFKVWKDEGYFIDDDDLPCKDSISELPDIYSAYRKSVEPLRARPRPMLDVPKALPPLPPHLPLQDEPFVIPTSLEGLKISLLKPFENDPSFGLTTPPPREDGMESAHPFTGGEMAAQERLSHLLHSGAMTAYKETRNGMLGVDFSTKLSGYLAQGHLTARQIHWAMVDFEDGKGEGEEATGYGKGENPGTAAVRFELLWRDYMRLCLKKHGVKIFDVHGFHAAKGKDAPPQKQWRYLDGSASKDDVRKTREVFERFLCGRTGMGLIDASNRELFHTGYTSNRARQNVASFLSNEKYLGIDWRLGAEWYQFLLIDYDVANNWGNWQYVAGVGNDPRQGRAFNPVKQAFDYDKEGRYVRTWVPELRGVQVTKVPASLKEEEREDSPMENDVDLNRLIGVFQAWKLSESEKESLGLTGAEWVDDPLVKISYSVGRGRGNQNTGRRGGGGGRAAWNSRGKNRGFRRLGLEDKASRGQNLYSECE